MKNFAIGFLFMAVFSVACNKDFNKKTGGGSDASLVTNRPAAASPNIILIISDDIGREIPTYNGGESYTTPNLDFMAANGTQFPYFFSHPDGPPSRLAFVTGKYSFRNYDGFGYLATGEKTIANMLHDNGYATCFSGKWQFDGGDTSIRSHGFDKYRVFIPYNTKDNNGHGQHYRRYKNPYLYENGRYLTDSEVNGKYSEDMLFDYTSNFIDSNKNKPFFIIYSNTLAQKPWVPTPDDPDYAGWDPAVDDEARDNRSYFPGMVKYLDKIIGKIITKVQNAGLANNTIIIFLSDNATNKQIKSQYKGVKIGGSKDSTTFNGINVPLLAYCPGIVGQGVKDTSLVDMTDFFPTLIDIANVSSASWQPLDGTTFYDNLTGTSGLQRSTVYTYWTAQNGKVEISYIFNYTYKMYDSINGSRFYNIPQDMYELHPLRDNQLTPTEKVLKDSFAIILKTFPKS